MVNQPPDRVEELGSIEEAIAVIRSAQDFQVVEPRALQRCLALSAEIKRLRVAADAARKKEAAKAISWIRRAIKTYKLTKQDIGL